MVVINFVCEIFPVFLCQCVLVEFCIKVGSRDSSRESLERVFLAREFEVEPFGY